MLAQIIARVRACLVRFAVFSAGPLIYRAHIVAFRLVGQLFWRLPSPEPIDLNRVQRVLVIRTDGVGDGVLNTPFLRELRRALPSARITLVVNPELHELLQICPYIDEVLKYECLIPFRWATIVLPWRALQLATSQLWPRQFDLALLPRRSFDWTYAPLLAFLSRARCRVAYTEHVNLRKHRFNPGTDRLFTHILKPERECQHEVHYNLDLLRFLGGTPVSDRTELWLLPEDEAFADALLGCRDNKEQLLIALCPGSSSVLRRWPVQKFANLITSMLQKYDCRFVVIGAGSERGLGAAIAAGAAGRVLDLVGKTTLRQAAAVLKRCDVAVANDSGPMHIAAAMGTQVVAVYGPGCEHRFGPWKNHTVVTLNFPCRPCNQGHVLDVCGTCIYSEPRCLTELPVEIVLLAVDQILSKRYAWST